MLILLHLREVLLHDGQDLREDLDAVALLDVHRASRLGLRLLPVLLRLRLRLLILLLLLRQLLLLIQLPRRLLLLLLLLRLRLRQRRVLLQLLLASAHLVL